MFNLTNIRKKNICIIGLMGSGKSIIGKDLSKFLKLKFYDSDKSIELKTKKSINSIFKEKGETYFRNIEEVICLELLKCNNCVISLGGGSIINKKIRETIKKNSFSIYLKVNIDILIQRLKSSKQRPLLNQNQNKRETLVNILKDRKNFYEKADLIVENDSDKFQIIQKIRNELKLYEN